MPSLTPNPLSPCSSCTLSGLPFKSENMQYNYRAMLRPTGHLKLNQDGPTQDVRSQIPAVDWYYRQLVCRLAHPAQCLEQPPKIAQQASSCHPALYPCAPPTPFHHSPVPPAWTSSPLFITACWYKPHQTPFDKNMRVKSLIWFSFSVVTSIPCSLIVSSLLCRATALDSLPTFPSRPTRPCTPNPALIVLHQQK